MISVSFVHEPFPNTLFMRSHHSTSSKCINTSASALSAVSDRGTWARQASLHKHEAGNVAENPFVYGVVFGNKYTSRLR